MNYASVDVIEVRLLLRIENGPTRQTSFVSAAGSEAQEFDTGKTLQYCKEHSGCPRADICEPCMSDVTRILSQIKHGDSKAAAQLLPLAYDELRKLAASKLAQQRPGQTLQATALFMKHTCDWQAEVARKGEGLRRWELE